MEQARNALIDTVDDSLGQTSQHMEELSPQQPHINLVNSYGNQQSDVNGGNPFSDIRSHYDVYYDDQETGQSSYFSNNQHYQQHHTSANDDNQYDSEPKNQGNQVSGSESFQQ